jgi:hypothetical protein
VRPKVRRAVTAIVVVPILLAGALFVGTTRSCPGVTVVLWLRVSRSLVLCDCRGLRFQHSFCTLVGPLPCNRASLYGLGHRSPRVRKNHVVVLLLVPTHGSRVVCVRTTGRFAFKRGGQAQPLGVTTQCFSACLALFS